MDRSGEGCWNWTGAINSGGYGSFLLNGVIGSASRAAWLLFVGLIPEGQVVCHRCDNRKCVRPTHLFLGTTKDNVADAVDKGRHPMPKATRRMTPETVKTMRTRRTAGERQTVLAKEYGMSQAQVSNIVRGQHWKEVV